jgi:hypothetical protein
MTFDGTIQNGVVVLAGGAELPEGTQVKVVVSHAAQPALPDRMSDEERARVLAIVERLASLPDENPGDNFSGADHDKVLYGEP